MAGRHLIFVVFYTANQYESEMHSVLITANFQREADRAKLSETEIQSIIAAIAADPLKGDLIPGSGGARKLRFARPGGGKSGGYRTVHYFAGDDLPVFLMSLIDKRERGNMTKAETNELAAILQRIADTYSKRTLQ